MLKNEVETAIALAREAGKRILTHYALEIIAEEKFDVDNVSEPVTAADRDASRLIVDGLRAEFPEDAILSEEENDDWDERRSRRRVWIIDPIDGTWGFIKKDGDFAVQIGLAIDGEPVLGVVFAPVSDTLYFASQGRGAYIVRSDGEPEQLSIDQKTDFAQMIIATSRNHRNPRITRISEHFGFLTEMQRGSIGIKVGLIAEKFCDLYINLSPRSRFWDTCGPQAIMEEAGGVLSDIFGERIRYDIADVQNYDGIVAASAAAHPLIIAEMKPLLSEFNRQKLKARAV